MQVEYAKGSPNDLLIRLKISNRGGNSLSEALPKIFFRNTWIWGCQHEGCTLKPSIRKVSENRLDLDHQTLGIFHFEADAASDGTSPEFAFTENETNTQSLYGVKSYTTYFKDGIERWVVNGDADAVNPEEKGTISAARFVPANESVSIELRLFSQDEAPKRVFGKSFEQVFEKRIEEANAFFDSVSHAQLTEEERRVERQAYAGLLWTKQFYHYSVHDWMRGDPDISKPPKERLTGRMGTLVQSRRDIHAGQMGISLVRGLGPGFPHDPFRTGRSGFRQETADTFSTRMVYASQWADSRLRVGSRRR